MTKKERILEILSRKEAATPLKDRLLDAASQTEVLARSREGVSSIAGGIGGGLLGALLSRGSRKKRIRDILLGAGLGVAGGYAAGKYITPGTSAAKEEYDPVVDGARLSQEPTEDNSTREEKAAPQKAPQKAPQEVQDRADVLSERQPDTAVNGAKTTTVSGSSPAQFFPEAQGDLFRRPTFVDPIDHNNKKRSIIDF